MGQAQRGGTSVVSGTCWPVCANWAEDAVSTLWLWLWQCACPRAAIREFQRDDSVEHSTVVWKPDVCLPEIQMVQSRVASWPFVSIDWWRTGPFLRQELIHVITKFKAIHYDGCSCYRIVIEASVMPCEAGGERQSAEASGWRCPWVLQPLGSHRSSVHGHLCRLAQLFVDSSS